MKIAKEIGLQDLREFPIPSTSLGKGPGAWESHNRTGQSMDFRTAPDGRKTARSWRKAMAPCRNGGKHVAALEPERDHKRALPLVGTQKAFHIEESRIPDRRFFHLQYPARQTQARKLLASLEKPPIRKPWRSPETWKSSKSINRLCHICQRLANALEGDAAFWRKGPQRGQGHARSWPQSALARIESAPDLLDLGILPMHARQAILSRLDGNELNRSDGQGPGERGAAESRERKAGAADRIAKIRSPAYGGSFRCGAERLQGPFLDPEDYRPPACDRQGAAKSAQN